MDAQEATWHREMWNGQVKRTDMGTKMFCEISPHIMLNSHGAWEKLDSGPTAMSFWEYPLPRIEIAILSTFLSWRFFDVLFKKLGVPIPRFTSMMLVGALLSETFQSSKMSWFRHIFVCDIYMPRVAETIGTFAFVLNWFLRGVTTNIGMVKNFRTRSIVIGVAAMIIPWYIGKLVYTYREKSSDLTMTNIEYSVIILTTSMAPFTCINMLLTDLKVVHTEFGQIAQSSAMVTDVLAFTMTISSQISRDYYSGMRMGLALMVFFVSLYLVRQAMLWVVRHTPEGAPVKNIYIYIGLLLGYLAYIFWDYFLFFGPLGAFVLGLAIPEGPPLGSEFIRRFDSFNEGIFLPLFGSLTMIKLDWSFVIKELGSGRHLHGHTYECLSFLFIIYMAKFTTSFLTAIASRMPLRDSAILGIIMGTKSSFELAYVLYAFDKERISLEVFTLMGIYILINSLLTPMAIHFLYDREKRFASYGERSLKQKPELQMVVCINKPDNITSMINLLRATAPSKESPLMCCVLHLIELVGKATPTFISHQLQKPKPGSQSYSENVISSFQMFQDIHLDYTSIHMFTSLTSTKEMHEHICWFALDKNSNLILLSFHRNWGPSGYGIISDDQTLRNLNRSVLKRAPCTVGILVHRKPIWQPKSVESPCRVCLVSAGGNDDKEALALADHMRGNPKVSLTVLTLIPMSIAEERSGEWSQNQMVDTCLVEERPGDKSITYIVRMVAEGGETSKILHSVAYDYDMFIVGRSSGNGTEATKGLGDWTEFEELGIIGDLLASEDFPSRASVLVLQQQVS
ncbi:cation/H(+) antiporter 6B [Brassica napus]|nr:PREDICTED: cation/H(+) antiporter 6B [Brassica oleracea var. oleracea]XP_013709764.2 cation/H(+) antiporter 6B [Brassica napus]